ncbi:hypothetical protein KX928_23265 [Roseobacter sp. YSTF-M11]|uniref:Uncharacterized protein n=1 Tax=Roseobacter insulae TaxID=2859783 RepID=A0A9X1FYV0_9RHOB|nr:hypothetical protein [Roseobacter insulae]MBW4710720.1 hypothetical protein [Roseobacter insulae]
MSALVRRKQLINHDPENGKFGDCYRTCVAMVMGLDPAEVPHFCDGNPDDVSGTTGLRNWLAPQGLGVFQVIYGADTPFRDVMFSLCHLSPEIPTIITGMGTRGVNHCVVAIGGEVFCDPCNGKPVKKPFTGPAEQNDEAWWWIEVIAKVPTHG